MITSFVQIWIFWNFSSKTTTSYGLRKKKEKTTSSIFTTFHSLPALQIGLNAKKMSNRPAENSPNTGTLQELLALTTSLTNSEHPNTVGSVDPERAQFFFNSLQGVKGSYQDDVEIIKQSLANLRKRSGENETSSDSCVNSLENIMDLVDHIDVASDFQILGGFPVVSKFLNVSDPDTVKLAAEIIGICCQNHPKCQQAVIENAEIFPNLFSVLKAEKYADNVKMKAVFALSSSIQNNPSGHDKFKKMDGYDLFLRILKSAGIPLRLRICFVFDCLCSQFPDMKSVLLEKQYISHLVELLNSIPLEDSKETVLNAMFTFVEGFYDAISECKKEEHNLIPTLEYLIAHYNADSVVEKEKAVSLKNELNKFTNESDKK